MLTRALPNMHGPLTTHSRALLERKAPLPVGPRRAELNEEPRPYFFRPVTTARPGSVSARCEFLMAEAGCCGQPPQPRPRATALLSEPAPAPPHGRATDPPRRPTSPPSRRAAGTRPNAPDAQSSPLHPPPAGSLGRSPDASSSAPVSPAVPPGCRSVRSARSPTPRPGSATAASESTGRSPPPYTGRPDPRSGPADPVCPSERPPPLGLAASAPPLPPPIVRVEDQRAPSLIDTLAQHHPRRRPPVRLNRRQRHRVWVRLHRAAPRPRPVRLFKPANEQPHRPLGKRLRQSLIQRGSIRLVRVVRSLKGHAGCSRDSPRAIHPLPRCTATDSPRKCSVGCTNRRRYRSRIGMFEQGNADFATASRASAAVGR